jgi:1-acyl-sn-glycerol-3-phosphate acyltransferase
LKKGAFVLAIEAGAPVQPVLVTGTRDLLPRGALFPCPGTVQVTFLPAIPTTDLAYDDRHQLMESTAQAMQDLLQTRPAAAMAETAP